MGRRSQQVLALAYCRRFLRSAQETGAATWCNWAKARPARHAEHSPGDLLVDVRELGRTMVGPAGRGRTIPGIPRGAA